MRDFYDLADFEKEQIDELLALTVWLKQSPL
jgi:hypothetical protein